GHADLSAVGGDPADRHDVAEVPVSHQRRALGTGGHVPQLPEGAFFMLAEYFRFRFHCTFSLRPPAPCRQRPFSSLPGFGGNGVGCMPRWEPAHTWTILGTFATSAAGRTLLTSDQQGKN